MKDRMMRYLASHENTTRGTSDFPLELYYVDMLHPRYEMPFHWHMECELLLVLQGEFTLLTDGQSYTLHPGIPPFFLRTVHGGIPKDCVYECLVFDLNHLIKITEDCFSRNMPGSFLLRPRSMFCIRQALPAVRSSLTCLLQ